LPVVMVGVSDNGNPLEFVEATKRGLVAQIQNKNRRENKPSRSTDPPTTK
jgi:hypothetical protein